MHFIKQKPSPTAVSTLPAVVMRSENSWSKWASRAACCTCFAAALFTAVQGFIYWRDTAGILAAAITIIADIIAFVGPPLSMERRGWRRCAALVLSACAAVWCCYTMIEKYSADGHARAELIAHADPGYIEASSRLNGAAAALQTAMGERPPACACPQSIRVWQDANAERMSLLQRQVDEAQERLSLASPPAPGWDPAAIAQAAFLELIKLIGIFAFQRQVRPTSASRESSRLSRRRRIHAAVPTGFVVMRRTLNSMLGMGVATTPAHAAQMAPNAPPAPMHNAPSTIVQHADEAAQRRAAIAQAREWALGGVARTEIARRLGVHRNTVHNWLRLK